jgi:hypothetical protein
LRPVITELERQAGITIHVDKGYRRAMATQG